MSKVVFYVVHHLIDLYLWIQVFCTWVLFLSLCDTKGRDVLSNVMFWFYRWRWPCWFRSKKKTESIHPNSGPVFTSNVQPSSPTTDSRQHLITLQDQLHSVLRSNPRRENGVFGGKSKLVMLTDWLVCIMYLCSEIMFIFSKLTNWSYCFSVHGDTLLFAYRIHINEE
jgi:hypothetical protein